MFEWILVVWMISPSGEIAPAFEVGTYRQLDGETGCVQARDSVKTERSDVGIVAMCIERDKQ